LAPLILPVSISCSSIDFSLDFDQVVTVVSPGWVNPPGFHDKKGPPGFFFEKLKFSFLGRFPLLEKRQFLNSKEWNFTSKINRFP